MLGWLIYASAIAALVGLAAWAAEWSLRGTGRPTRWVWSVSLVLSVALPVLAGALLPRLSPEVVRASGAMIGGVVPLSLDVMAPAEGSASTIPLERVLMACWAVVSLGLLAYLVVSARRIRRLHRRWTRDAVDGVAVLVSGSVGPAAMGILRGTIVVPRWALALDRRLRRLMVLHEEEHVRAGDPALVLAGLMLCVALPWNLPLWWQLARLRLAVEVDCDARVLRRVPDAASYGRLLIEVGRRRRRGPALGVAFSRPTSLLERRIRRITERRRAGVLRSLVAGLASLALLAVACGTPTPDEIAGPGAEVAGPDSEIAAADAAPAIALPSDPACAPVIEIDGERVPNGEGRLAGLDPATIERIEVIKGAAASRVAGEEVCGLIHIFLKGDGADAAVQEPHFTPFTVEPRLRNVDEVRRLLAEAYRASGAEGSAGMATVWFYIDARGDVAHVRLNRSSGNAALDEAALEVARRMRFEPALNRDEPVPVWVSLPVRFEPPAG